MFNWLTKRAADFDTLDVMYSRIEICTLILVICIIILIVHIWRDKNDR